MKKLIISTILALFCAALAFGADYTAMLESAKHSSTQYANIENVRISSENSIRLQQMGQRTPGYTVTVNQSETIEGLASTIPTVNLNAALPTTDNGVDISLGLSLMDGKNAMRLLPIPQISDYFVTVPSVKVSKTFTFNETEMTDVALTTSRLNAYVTYNRSLLQFENSFIDSLVSLMEMENRIETSRRSLERSRLDFENSVRSGQIDMSSLVYKSTMMTLSASESQLSSLENTFSIQKRSFTNTFGIPYERVTEVPDVKLTLTESSDGNTEVRIKYLKMIDAKNSLDALTGDSRTLSLTGDVQYLMGIKSDDYKSMLNAGAGLTFQDGSLVITSDVKTSKGLDGKFTEPVFTVTGSYGKSDRTEISKSSLTLAYNNAVSEYENSLVSYNSSIMSLSSELSAHYAEKLQAQNRLDYDLEVLENQRSLYEKGFISERALNDAQNNYDADVRQMTVIALKALKLSNSIRIIEL